MANTPEEIREQIVRALEADLVGPFDPESGEEMLPLPPSRWYLTGFLVPQGSREIQEDPTAEDELSREGVTDDEEPGDGERPSEPKQKKRLPASMGLSVLLPPGPPSDTVRVTVSWAEYTPEERASEDGKETKTFWRRAPRTASVLVPLDPARIAAGVPLTADGVDLAGKLETVNLPGAGTRNLALFVVNSRKPEPGRQDERSLFQVAMEIAHEGGILPRANRSDGGSTDGDTRIADLQYRNRFEYAVGHGVSVATSTASAPPEGSAATVPKVRTAWIPCSEVPGVTTRVVPEVTTGMEELGRLADSADGKPLAQALAALPARYGEWITEQRKISVDTQTREVTRDKLMDEADRARQRIADGIQLLEGDAEVRRAFQLANRAMAAAARARNPERYEDGKVPSWHLFQLAFVLLNLPGLADDRREDRDDVELIFFPTGGGKTEAYLGVIACALLLRRLRGRERPDGGLGVAVLLRYTLRLLTLDQLGRAATLICALEELRRADPERLGEVRFAVGLWVGRTATANTLAEVAEAIRKYKVGSGPSPFPLTECPWCRTPFTSASLQFEPPVEPREVLVGCVNFHCAFARGRAPEGLPVLFVDEQIYRELPAFLLATVDKFAMLPFRGAAGALFGRVERRSGRGFWGPMDIGGGSPAGASIELPDGLWPPELIVQDELHLISGPLGTMVGLYETAVETLSTRIREDGTPVRPKILASTATVRRAREQIRALFGRQRTAVFPPPGVDDAETWFAEIDHDGSKRPGRLYVGVAAPGRAIKAILLRAHVVLLAAAKRQYDPAVPASDAYMTLVGYYNSLRELGGMRRLIEDEVLERTEKAEDRRPADAAGPHPWFRRRTLQQEPVELTSRETIDRVKKAKDRLAKAYSDPEHVDVLLASSMISVGVDIDRLGLMLIAGQPKATSEYIQASSRVGRTHPGLVVTCFNLHKPRDRSHYERFPAYHQSFYRSVEASSLTPFSGPALDRGLAGTLLAMSRLGDPAMTPPGGAMRITSERAEVQENVRRLAERAAGQPGVSDGERAAVAAAVTTRGEALVDAWWRLVEDAPAGGFFRTYSPYERGGGASGSGGSAKPLLYTVLDSDRPAAGTDEALFAAPTSMRDVEPVTHLWVERGRLGRKS